MSYLVLARKYRPINFNEVVGQNHITELLEKSIESKRIAHAFLFCGPRGIGKTSCARILAKTLNCISEKNSKPCNKCVACSEINEGRSFDVLEIDGASNRGIDEIRTLRENVKFAPSYGSYKIYIVDEVHMLTIEAFNALLKTLEEPPPHVIFIFATTDPNKVPPTIISRCQRYDFKRIPFKITVDALEAICKKEKFKVEKEALYAITKASQGSFRDALSILDQISALKDTKIQGSDVYSMLGLVETEFLFELSKALSQKDCSKALKIYDKIIDVGKDIKQLYKDLTEHFRNLMVIRIGGKSLGRLIDYPVEIKEMYLEQSKTFSLKDLLGCLDYLIEAQDISRITESLRTPLEIAFAKMTYTNDMEKINDLSEVSNSKKKSSENKVMNKQENDQKLVAVELLRNQKGQISISQQNENKEEINENKIKKQVLDVEVETVLDLEEIKRLWNVLTYAVSRKKMSMASYLQEGFPVELDDKKLTIGFKKDHIFYKESLEENNNVALIEQIFSKKLKNDIRIAYKIVDYMESKEHSDEPLIKTALETFKGKIINKWHKE